MAKRKFRRWARFISATKGRKPISYLDEAAALVGNRGLALDLGCGAGVDSRRLAENGLQVTAIDRDSAAIRSTKTLCKGLLVKAKRDDIRDLRLTPRSVDLVIAWNSLPFLSRTETKRVLRAIQAALAPGGVFIFSLFGPDDAWARADRHLSFTTRAEMKECLQGVRFIEIREIWRNGPTAVGGATKAWHKVQGMAQKQAGLSGLSRDRKEKSD